MLEVVQQIVDPSSLRSTAQQLVDIRRQLAEEMLVRFGGFRYESIFGGSLLDHSFEDSYIAVRVELSDMGEGKIYQFRVFVDFCLPTKVSLKEAEHFRRATNNAVKTAEWAQNLVRGFTWDIGTIASLEVE